MQAITERRENTMLLSCALKSKCMLSSLRKQKGWEAGKGVGRPLQGAWAAVAAYKLHVHFTHS